MFLIYKSMELIIYKHMFNRTGNIGAICRAKLEIIISDKLKAICIALEIEKLLASSKKISSSLSLLFRLRPST